MRRNSETKACRSAASPLPVVGVIHLFVRNAREVLSCLVQLCRASPFPIYFRASSLRREANSDDSSSRGEETKPVFAKKAANPRDRRKCGRKEIGRDARRRVSMFCLVRSDERWKRRLYFSRGRDQFRFECEESHAFALPKRENRENSILITHGKKSR